MFKRYYLPALAALALALPANAQPLRGGLPEPTQSNPNFLALFKPTLAAATKSVVRVQVDGKDASLGTVVSDDGYVLTKASELKLGKVSIKTKDGRNLDAEVTATSEAYDLAVLKTDGSGLTPITWGTSKDAPVGNWVSIASLGGEPAAVGVVSTRPWAPRNGFLGVGLDQTMPPDTSPATIGQVIEGSAAEAAGLKPKDVILKIDTRKIPTGAALIETLSGYQDGEQVAIVLKRDGKELELKVVLGRRPAEPATAGGGRGGLNRGDMQNSMGSKLSDRRTGIPKLFQTDAVVKPGDCGGPVVDLDGHAVGLIIARAGRTESHAIPAETVKDLIPVLLAARPRSNPGERVDQARAALKKAEAAKASSEVLAEARRQLQTALGEEKWWKDQKWWKGYPIERAPAPHVAAAPAKK
jgi:serine protease Do